MFIPKTITEYNIRIEKEQKDNSNKYYYVLNKLDFFKKKRLIRLNTLINRIIKTIEKDSYWDYTNEGFIFRSDYFYDTKKKDILYKENKIIKNNNGYHVSDMSNIREYTFYEVYKYLLNRLFILENKRDDIYKEFDSNIVNIKDYINDKRNNSFVNNFTNEMAASFFDKHSYDGIIDIVYLLNSIDTKDSRDAYRQLVNSAKNNAYKMELLNWIATYCKKGKEMLGLSYEKEVNNVTYKSLREIKDEIMIKYNL